MAVEVAVPEEALVAAVAVEEALAVAPPLQRKGRQAAVHHPEELTRLRVAVPGPEQPVVPNFFKGCFSPTHPKLQLLNRNTSQL